MFFLDDDRARRALAVLFFLTVGVAVGLGAYHANGAELDGQWVGQSALVVLAFTFAMRSSQELREARERRRQIQADRAGKDRNER